MELLNVFVIRGSYEGEVTNVFYFNLEVNSEIFSLPIEKMREPENKCI